MGDFNWSSLASGVGSLAGGILGLVSSNKKNTNDWNINQANIDLQREINEKNEQLWREKFDYDKWQYMNTLAYNSLEAQKAFEREANWNSPYNQMQMLRSAGINPFSVFGQNANVSAVHSSPASGANSSTTPPPSMLAPQLSYQNSSLAATLQMVDAVANVIDKVSSAKLKGSQKNQIDSLIDDTVKKLRAETKNQEALANINKLEASFKETFGMLEADARYQKLVAEASDLWQSIALKISQGELIDEQKQTEQSKRMLNDIEGKLKGEQKRLFKLQADNYLIVQAQNIKESNSRIESNRASAEESRASAKRMNELTPHEVDKLKYDALDALENYFGKSLDNEQKAKLMPILEESVKRHVRQQGADYWNPFRYVGSLLGGTGAQAVKEFFK